MRHALISDIHGNLEALQAVLADIEQQNVDAIHCLGDIIGYGCNPVECLELVTDRCEKVLLGNHEFALLGLLSDIHLNAFARESMDWTRTRVTDREISVIADFLLEANIEGAYLVHSSPYEPDQWHYILSVSEANVSLNSMSESLGFFGHTHVPNIFALYPDGRCRAKVGCDFSPDAECKYLVNVGSVGQPRDNDPRSCYLVYDSSQNEISYRRVEYDLELTQSKMADAHIDRMLIERLEVGR